jgi:hypothetical protein
MNLRAILFGLIALAVALPAAAANKGTAEFGIDQTGACRDVAVRDIVLSGWVPIGCLDVSTHQFIINSATGFGNQSQHTFLGGPISGSGATSFRPLDYSDLNFGTQTQSFVFAAPAGANGAPSFRVLGLSDLNLGSQSEHTFFAGPSSGSGTPAFRAFASSDFDSPGTNIRLGSDALATVTPDLPDPSDGVSNIAVGSGAMQYTESANSTVAIGVDACQNYGKRRVLLDNDDDFTGWSLGTGWAAATGFATHTAGNTASMTRSTTEITDNTPYFLNFTITGWTAGTITPKLSGGGATVTGTAYAANGDQSQLFRGNEGNAQVEFAPSSNFNGAISAVTFVTLGGRTTVCLGHLAGQYIGNAPSSTFVGGYAGQGLETDTVTGLDISGTEDASPLSGTNNACVGEACMLHIRGGASTNDSVGFNTLFNMTTGSGNAALGNAAMSYGTTLTANVGIGSGAYKYGNGTNNTFSGASAGLGNEPFHHACGRHSGWRPHGRGCRCVDLHGGRWRR